MASDLKFVEFVVDQIKLDGEMSFKSMFGEYGLYCMLDTSPPDELPKFFSVICDNKFFVKPTKAGKEFIENTGTLSEAPPYEGAKDSYLIEEKLDDAEWVGELVTLTVNELPKRKPRKPKKKKK